MLKIAISGNIASGKSQAEKILSELSYIVIDTDKIAHDLLTSDENIITTVKSAFSEFDITDNNGNLSREKIGKIVFNNNEKKSVLENILHTKIFEILNILYKKYKEEKIVFISIPLLFETKKQNDFDKIIFISANEDIRLKRLIKRNNYAPEYAKLRINSQQGETEKIKQADFVVYNNTTIENLKKQLTNIIKSLT